MSERSDAAASPPCPAPLREPLEADAAAVRAGLLQPACASFFAAAAAPTRAIALALHGFTAGPYQFTHLSQRLAQAGIATYAARLPGHGARLHSGEPSWLELPKSAELAQYSVSAEGAMQRARAVCQSLRVPLHLIGFSMGGALALDLALRHPRQVGRLVLLAPLLQPQGQLPRALFALLRQAQRFGIGPLLDRLPFSWGKEPHDPQWDRPGHWKFRLGHVYAVLSYAAEVYRQPLPLRVPTQLITSGADRRCDPRVAGRLLRRSTMPTYAYHFPAPLQVPHAMLSPQENRSGQTLAQVETMVQAFLARGEGSDNRRIIF